MKSIKDLAFLTMMIVFMGIAKPGCTISIVKPQLKTDSSPEMIESESELRQVIVNQEQVASIFDSSDKIPKYIPVAPIVEALGWTYCWNKVTQTVTVEQQDGIITTFTIGDPNVTRNGYPLRIRESPKIIDTEDGVSGQIWLHRSDISRVFDIDYASWDQVHRLYRVYQFPEPDQLQTDLEKIAIEAVVQHLQEQQIELTRSPSGGELPRNIEIQSAQQLTDLGAVDNGLIKVVVNFSGSSGSSMPM